MYEAVFVEERVMQTATIAGRGFVIIVLIALFAVWYSIAANYDYSALAGTYTLKANGETCTLQLHPDGTFVEELGRSGEVQKSEGRWDRYGESHVSFSSEFLKLSGEELNAAGQAHGEFEKRLGIFPALVLAPVPDGPTLHRKLLR